MKNEEDKLGESLVILMDKLRGLSTVRWSEFHSKVLDIAAIAGEDDLKDICTYTTLFDSAFGSARNNWIVRRTLDEVLPMFPDLGEFLLENSEVSQVRETIVDLGLYKDITILNKIALTETGPAQLIGVTFCDIKTLRKLKGHSDPKIRKVYFSRLGVVECLDDMLADKKAEIRAEGIRRAPYYYDSLKTLTKEIARDPFSILVDKISSEYIPMLLANRNVKNHWIAAKIEKRLSKAQLKGKEIND